MAEDPQPASPNTTEPPAPEVLQVHDDTTPAPDPAPTSASPQQPATPPQPATKARHGGYRPSHKATFLGVAVVTIILAINAGIIGFVILSQSKPDAQSSQQAGVTISAGTLEKLGVSRNSVGNLGAELVVNPTAKFNGSVTMSKDVSVAGQLKLNGKFSAPEASFTKLEAGDTQVSKLGINGDASATNLTLRRDLTVAGATKLQGTVLVTQLLTVNNSLNVAGNLAVGGSLQVRNLHVSSFVTDSTLTLGGHIITRGSAPGVSAGSVGSNGTVSISGNDMAGTVAVNVGAGGASGIVARVDFRNDYTSTPHVAVTQVGPGGSGVYTSRTASGFSIGVNGSLSPGGYAFDYIVMQ